MSTIASPPLMNSGNRPNTKLLWLIASLYPIVAASIGLAWSHDSATELGPLQTLSGLLLVVMLLTSTLTDLSRRKIYNWITYTTFVWAIAINSLPFQFLPETLAVKVGAIGIAASLIGTVTCFCIMLIPYSLAHGGAGDVKLATAIGALVGMQDGLLVIAMTYIVAAMTIIGWSIWTRGPVELASACIRKLLSTIAPHKVDQPTQDQNYMLEKPTPLAGFFLIATLLVVLDAPALLRSL